MTDLVVGPQRQLTEEETACCERSIPSVFEEIAKGQPDALALGGDEPISYAELADAANRVARGVQARLGEAPEPVGLAFASPRQFLEGLLGVLKAGKIAMPLDAAAPDARLDAVVRDSGTSLLLGDYPTLGANPVVTLTELGGDAAGPLNSAPTADSPALLLYTSGSTGEPKGILTRHGTDVHSALMAAQRLDAGPGSRVALVLPRAFAAAFSVISSALLSGAALFSYAVEEMGIGALPAWIEVHDVSATVLVSGMVGPLAAAARSHPMTTLRRVLIGSDVLTPADADLARRMLAPTAQAIHTYSSTEARTMCSQSLLDLPLTADSPVPIGRPEPGKEILLRELDDGLGEIVVRSRYLSLGYWRRDDETGRSFSSDSGGSRTYRTGDLGRLDDAGRLVLEGRRDRMVKIRGKRVELDAVERALRSQEQVADAAVVVDRRAAGTGTVVAYLTSRGDELDQGAVREAMRRTLPAEMVPGRLVTLDELPRLPSGKLDRRALAEPPETPELSPTEPASELERELVEIWQELLERPVGIDQDFFELGGDSLLAMEMVVVIEERLSYALRPSKLLEASTIKRLAELIRDPDALTEPQQESEESPLFLLYPLAGTALIYRTLTAVISDDVPLQMLEAPWWDGDAREIRTVEQLAAFHIDELKRVQPAGPYFIAGFSSGGLLAYEIARQLSAMGERIALLVLLDTYLGRDPEAGADPRLWPMTPPIGALHRLRRRAWMLWAVGSYRLVLLRTRAALPARRLRWRLDLHRFGSVRSRRREAYVVDRMSTASRLYRPLPYDGRVVFLRATEATNPSAEEGWEEVAQGGLEIHDMPGSHLTMLFPRHVMALVSTLSRLVENARDISAVLG